jgi:hypothetical protein
MKLHYKRLERSLNRPARTSLLNRTRFRARPDLLCAAACVLLLVSRRWPVQLYHGLSQCDGHAPLCLAAQT